MSVTDHTLAEVVESAMTRHPHRIALETSAGALTYAQLWQRARAIADRLPMAVGRPTRVGLYAGPSEFAYLGYLAVIASGGTVVPMNPAFPVARNAHMGLAADVDALLLPDSATDDLSPLLLRERPVPIIQGERADKARRASPIRRPGPDDVAYILFTSGSTGYPKGVPITHRAVHAYIRHVVDRAGIDADSRLSQTFSLTFDPSVSDLFAAWSTGAAIVSPDPRDLLRPAQYVRARRLTHWFSVPSVVSVAHRLRKLPAGSMPGLRWSGFIGEPLTADQAEAWRAAAPRSVIDNVYGPTELTIACAEYRWPLGSVLPETSNGTLPIGEIYPHLESVIIGDDGQPCDEGELCVRGVQRFTGYLNDADNSGRFLHFHGAGPAAVYVDGAPLTDRHWYRTGDRVRREDGLLVHLGRLDNQVKLSGYRIELGEIEAVIRRHPRVMDAVALVVEDPAKSDRRLCAWYVGSETLHDEVMRELSGSLPHYMVPSRLTAVATMPLNANGKIDRRVLRDGVLSGQQSLE